MRGNLYFTARFDGSSVFEFYAVALRFSLYTFSFLLTITAPQSRTKTA